MIRGIAQPHPAVVAIDLHRGHLDPKVATMPLEAGTAARVVAANARFLRWCRAASIPVFHCVATYRDAEEIRANPGWRARAEDPSDLRNTVLITGVNTNSCVLATSAAACCRDYAVVVVSDCVDTMDGPEFHQWALRIIGTAFGQVLSADEIMALGLSRKTPSLKRA